MSSRSVREILKISPMKDIADLAIGSKIEALIISNTTIDKSILAEKYSDYSFRATGRYKIG